MRRAEHQRLSSFHDRSARIRCEHSHTFRLSAASEASAVHLGLKASDCFPDIRNIVRHTPRSECYPCSMNISRVFVFFLAKPCQTDRVTYTEDKYRHPRKVRFSSRLWSVAFTLGSKHAPFGFPPGSTIFFQRLRAKGDLFSSSSTTIAMAR